MLTVAISKRNKLQNIIVLTPKDGVRTPEGAGRNHCFWRQRSSGGGDFFV